MKIPSIGAAIGACIKTPITIIIDAAFHNDDSLTQRISNKATVFFGGMGFCSTLSTFGCAIKFGIEATVDYAITQTLSVGAQSTLLALKVSLCGTVIAFLLFAIAASVRHYVNKPKGADATA